jgi:MYXO-CTERM domain-containing protein
MLNQKSLRLMGTMLPIAAGLSLMNAAPATAYTITFDPITTFEVGDGFGPVLGYTNEPFDGKGDTQAVFPGNFSTVFLGTAAANSENAEYDLSQLAIPTGATITSAIFQFTVSQAETVAFTTPAGRSSGLIVRGYAGNGQADAADFQAGNILGTQSIAREFVDETVRLDVTNFIQQLSLQPNAIAGFSIRANGLGAQSVTPYPTPPRLIITTKPINEPPQSTPEASTRAGLVGLGLLGTYFTTRRRRSIGR